GVNGLVVQEGEPILISNCKKDPRFIEALEIASLKISNLLAVPLKIKNRPQGVLTICNKEKDAYFSRDILNLMTILANQAAINIENAYLFQKIEELSITDEYTQLYNMRFFRKLLDREVHRIERFGGILSLAFFDLDHFKDINDTYGHLMGSRTLKELADLIKGSIRKIDEITRYGGDEFVILLPNTDCNRALIVADRLRNMIEQHSFLTNYGLDVKITASFGIASYPTHSNTVEDLIRQADVAMYGAKKKGRNKVIIAEKGKRKETKDYEKNKR
ncbi:MAG: sensor domain-containing diguanylate cyclase, partial [bacterium]